MNYFFTLFFLVGTLLGSSDDRNLKSSGTIELYVSLSGDDSAAGSKSRALKSLDEALARTKQTLDVDPETRVRILINEGTYHLESPILITDDHISDSRGSLEFVGLSKNVTISGGQQLKPNGWKKVPSNDLGELWAYQLNDLDTLVVRQLFKSGERVPRSSSPIFKTNGPIKQFQGRIKKYDHSGINSLRSETLVPFCSFEYFNNDLVDFRDTANAEIVIHHSWESSWHEIGMIDHKDKAVYLTNAFRHPIGFFNNQVSYRIENSQDHFATKGTWIFDKKSKTIFYYPIEGEDIDKLDFVIPRQNELLKITGKKDNPARNIYFSNITFSYTSYPWGVQDVASSIIQRNEKKYSWMDFTKGYAGTQVAAKSGHSISLNYSTNIQFNNCVFSNLGAYALKIGRGSSETVIDDCEMRNNGAGGVLIGDDIRNFDEDKYPRSEAPHNNTVTRTKIHDSGLIHPSGVGIAILQSYGNKVENNTIYNLPYSGISLGWTWNEGPNYSQDNLVSNNEIYEVMQLLADGAGIYALGNLNGSVIKNNYVHNLSRSNVAVGASVNGIFFDQGSSNIEVLGNRIEKIQGKTIKFNKANSKTIFLRDNIERN